MRQLLSCIFFFFGVWTSVEDCQAQTADLVQGYVILESGDTLKGQLRYRSRDGLKEKIYLKISESEKKYLPLMSLSGFKADSLVYQKIQIGKRQVFAKILALGHVDLVEEEYLRDYQGQSLPAFRLYFRPSESLEWEEVKTGGNKWRSQMAELLQSNPELAGTLENKALSPDDLARIFRQYNSGKTKQ